MAPLCLLYTFFLLDHKKQTAQDIYPCRFGLRYISKLVFKLNLMTLPSGGAFSFNLPQVCLQFPAYWARWIMLRWSIGHIRTEGPASMRKWWHSIFVKFSIAFIVVGIIPLFALSVFSLQTFTSHVQKYTVNNLQQMVLYMGYNLNNALFWELSLGKEDELYVLDAVGDF